MRLYNCKHDLLSQNIECDRKAKCRRREADELIEIIHRCFRFAQEAALEEKLNFIEKDNKRRKI